VSSVRYEPSFYIPEDDILHYVTKVISRYFSLLISTLFIAAFSQTKLYPHFILFQTEIFDGPQWDRGACFGNRQTNNKESIVEQMHRSKTPADKNTCNWLPEQSSLPRIQKFPQSQLKFSGENKSHQHGDNGLNYPSCRG
jgi:hypothetical protein